MLTYQDYTPTIKRTRIERVDFEQAKEYENMFRAWAASVGLDVSDMNGTVVIDGQMVQTISVVALIRNSYFARHSALVKAVDQVRVTWDSEDGVFEFQGWNDEDADVACAMLVAYCNWHSAVRNLKAGPNLLGVLRMETTDAT